MELKLIGKPPKKEIFRCPNCGYTIEIWHIGNRITRLYGMKKVKENFECICCGATFSLKNER